VLRVDGRSWAQLSLFRAEGRPAFGADEPELLAGLSAPLARAVRDHARPAAAVAEARGLGLMLFAPDGELTSLNEEALLWLEQLAWLDRRRPEVEEIASGVHPPLVVTSTLMHARAVAEEREHGASRARMRSGTGRWLVCHASCLRDEKGELGTTALVIEPAQAAEIAPIIVEAYDLSPGSRRSRSSSPEASARARLQAGCTSPRTRSATT
jgi:hypothetical protein